MPSQYTIFKPPRQSTPEPEQSSGGFLSNLFGGNEEPVQQQSTSQYTIFKPPRVSTVQEEQPKKPFFEQYRTPASFVEQKAKEYGIPDYTPQVRSFGMQTLASGLGTFTKGLGFILSLSKELPRRTVQALDRPIFGQPETPKYENIPWVKKTLDNYETAFGLAKELKPVSFTKGTDGKLDLFTEAVPRAVGQVLGAQPGFIQLITKGQDALKKEFEPEFAKDPNFIQNYSNASVAKKITQYPKETLRLMAPDVIGSGGIILGGTILTGGTGFPSLVLSAATGEDVKKIAMENGLDEQKATTLGIATAIPVMFLEKFGFDTILGKGKLANIGTSFGGKILKSAITEAGTESTQELWQAAMEDTFKEIPGNEYADRIGMAALGGALGGVLFGSTSSMVDTISGKYDAKAKAQAEQRLESVVDSSPKKSIIDQGLDYKPTENSVLKQSFVDSLTQDVLQQTEMITDPKVKQRAQKAINGLRTKEYSNIREFEVELAKQLPKNVEPFKFEQTAIGQDFNKAIANTDEDMRVIMIQRAFEQKGPKGQRIPLSKESITTAITGTTAAPKQNIIGDTISRINEEKDKIEEEAPNDPQAKQAVERAQVVVDQLQKAYNIQNAQEVIRQVKEEQTTPLTENLVDPLVQEAKKYKSAEEFVKAQGTPVYHASKNTIKEFGDVPDRGTRFYGKGTYFSKNIDRIKEFGDNITEAILNLKNPYTEGDVYNKPMQDQIIKLFGKKQGKQIIDSRIILDATKVNGEKLAEMYKKAGYDGIIARGGNDIAVFNPKEIVKTKSQLTDIWNKAQEVIRQVKEEQTATQAQPTIVPLPTTQIPKTPIQGTGKRRVSGLAAKVEAKAIEADLIKSFGQLPAFTSVKMDEQANLAANLVNTDIEKAKRIAYGEELPPNNMLLGSVFKAVESHALNNNDIETLQKLATQSTVSLEASALGQQLQAFKEIDPTSPVEVISDVKRQRTKNTEDQGINVNKETSKTMKEIDTEIKKQKIRPKDWNEFLSSIEC